MQLEKVLKNNESFGQMVWGPGYEAFEMLDNSMSDGTRRGLEVGDVLKCKKIERLNKIDDLKTFKYELLVVTSTGVLMGGISHQDGEKVILSRYNPAFKDTAINLTKAESIYLVEGFQRDMTPKAAARRAQTFKI